MKLNYVVRQSKVRKNGLAPIELSIIINGDRKVISLDRQINPKHWNPKSQTVKNNPEINTYLQAIIQKLYTTQTELIQHNIPVTLDTLLDAYKNGGVQHTTTIIALFKKHNEEYYKYKVLTNIYTKTSYDKYQKALEYFQTFLKQYIGKPDIQIKQITPQLIENYYSFLLQHMQNNTAIKTIKKLKTIIQLAIDEGYITTNPFKLKIKEDKVIHNPLTIEEINIIKNKEITIPRVSKVRDLFLFQCFTGLAYADMVNLSKDNIKEDMIIINRQKTNIQSIIPLLPQAKEILEKYEYNLPIISNQKLNFYLLEVGSICNIPQKLHTHLGRHTFATLLINAGVNITTIARALGHSNTRITEKTYAKLNNETVREEILTKMTKIA